MSRLTLFRTSGAASEAARPARIVEGSPETRFRIHATGENGRLSAGEWTATPGRWRVEYHEWEFCHVLAGSGILHEEGGDAIAIAAGDAFVIAPGFTGEWAVEETMTKYFVILDPPA